MRFNEKQFASEYEKRLLEEGYPGNLLNIISKELQGAKTVIDIGAGTGFFSIPLAKKGYKIVAVEPSVEMINIFKKKLTIEINKNISIIQLEWEKYNKNRSDAVICIHSIYPMKNRETAISNMLKFGDKRILLVKKSGTKNLTGEIRNYLNFSKKPVDFNDFITEKLKEQNTKYIVKEIIQERDVKFSDLDEKTDYYCYYLKLDNSKREAIKEILLNVTDKTNNIYCYKSVYYDNMYVF